MIKLRLHSLIVIVLLSLSACGGSSTSSSGGMSSGSGTATNSSPYFNLNQNSIWSYKTTTVYNPGTGSPTTTIGNVDTKVGTTTSGSTAVTMSVAGVTNGTTGSYTGYAYSMSFDANQNLLFTAALNRTWFFVDGTQYNAKFMPVNPALNTMWTVGGTTYTVTSMSGTITTSAGTFTNCMVIHATGTDNSGGATINFNYYFSTTAANMVYMTGSGTSISNVPFNETIDMTSYTLH